MDEDNQDFKITNARNIAKTNVNPLFETLKPIYAEVSTQENSIFSLMFVRCLGRIHNSMYLSIC